MMKTSVTGKRQRIVEALAAGPMTARALASALGIELLAVRQALNYLHERKRVARGVRLPRRVRSGHGGTGEYPWSLPGHVDAAPVSERVEIDRKTPLARRKAKREAHPERMALRRRIPGYRWGDY